MKKYSFILLTSALVLCSCGTKTVDYDAQASELEENIFTMDTHNHVDVAMSADEMPSPDADLKASMQKAGMDGIVMTFAVDYVAMGPNASNVKYDAWARFNTALDEQDSILKRSGISLVTTGDELTEKIEKKLPVVIQSVEGAHFIEGDTTRIEAAYKRGLRILDLFHDTDADPALGDVYTNELKYGGLTEIGAATIRECERLGILVDLAHADDNTVRGALKVATKPIMISHTGLNTQLGNNEKLAQIMLPRLISKELAKEVADAGGLIGVWPHLAFTAEEYAANIKAMVDVVGIDHVTIGTDTKITPELPMGNMPPKEVKGNNHVWEDEPTSFYHATIRELLKQGFSEDDITKICGGNFVRLFSETVK